MLILRLKSTLSTLALIDKNLSWKHHIDAYVPRKILLNFYKSLIHPYLRWLEIVSSTYVLMGRYDHSLSLDALIMVSKHCPTIGEHVVTISVT